MIIHDLRGPTDNIKNGLKEAQINMNQTFGRLYKDMYQFYKSKILSQERVAIVDHLFQNRNNSPLTKYSKSSSSQ